MTLVAGVAQFIRKSKLWQGGATSIIPATVGHAVTSRHTFVIFLMNSHLYQLPGVIYFGGQHFVACLIEQDTTVWYHDGMVTGQNMIYEGQLESVDLKHCRDGKKPSALFYTRILYQS